MKKVLIAAVLAVMAGGAYAADFADLQAFKALDIPVVKMTAAVPAPAALEAVSATDRQFLCYVQVVHLFRTFQNWDDTWTSGLSDMAVARLAFSVYDPERDVRVWDQCLEAEKGGLRSGGLLYRSGSSWFNAKSMFSLGIVKRYERGELPLCKGLVYYDGRLY